MQGVSTQALLSADSEYHGDTKFTVPSGSKCGVHAKQVLAVGLLAGCLLGVMWAAHQFPQGTTKTEFSEKINTSSFSFKSSTQYYWPSARGSVGSYLKSAYAGPPDISTPSWTWEYSCCPFCKWCTIPTGTAIDGEKNIYLTAADGIRKFSSRGELLWTSHRQGSEQLSKNAVLMGGAAYSISMNGRAFAVNMETGEDLWSRQVAEGSDLTNGAINAHEGVVVVPVDTATFLGGPGGSARVMGLNGTNGLPLWKFTPDDMVWNFSPTFAGDGTFIFQDKTGKAYRNFVQNGSLIWKNGGFFGTWCDGVQNVASNGIVYAVAGYADFLKVPYPGALSAFSLIDGKPLWTRNVTVAPNSVPTYGMLVGQTKPSVVIPTGYSSCEGPLDVHAFDAETGEDHWFFQGSYWKPTFGIGALSDWDLKVMAQRLLNRVRPVTIPNAWSMPTIDGEGIVFAADQSGKMFRLQDLDGDGKVSGPGEVQVLTTDAAWVGSANIAIIPGMLTTTNVKSLMVWNY